MSKSQSNEIRNLTLAAMLIALGVVLPTLTGTELNTAILPMHIPVLLAGFVLGPKYGLVVGFVTPLLRSVTFWMPPLPIGTTMAFELGTYGLVAGAIYSKVKQSMITRYVALISAMLIGRVVFGIATFFLFVGFRFGPGTYSLSMWATSVFATSLPGIVIQLIIIPMIVVALEHSGLMRKR